jgi:hypothetical protein
MKKQNIMRIFLLCGLGLIMAVNNSNAGSLDPNWNVVGENMAISHIEGGIVYDSSTMPANPWQEQILCLEFPLIIGKKYRFSFTSYGTNMRMDMRFRQQGGNWTAYSATKTTVLLPQVKSDSFEFIATNSDPKATFEINVGYGPGYLKVWNMSLVDTGESPIKTCSMDLNWWAIIGEVDLGGNEINMTISSIPQNPFEIAFGLNKFNSIAGKTFIVSFDAMASNNMRLLLRVRSAGAPWDNYSIPKELVLTTGNLRHTIFVTPHFNDSDSVLLFDVGYDLGTFKISNVCISEPLKTYLPTICK